MKYFSCRELNGQHTFQMIKAEDQGGLTSSARLQIRVSDTNDRNPEFTDLPYVFRVKENDLTGYVGRVQVNQI